MRKVKKKQKGQVGKRPFIAKLEARVWGSRTVMMLWETTASAVLRTTWKVAEQDKEMTKKNSP